MELIFEFIFELLLEGGLEISSNKKVNKWIRYPILAIIILFFLTIILGLIFIGITMIEENVFASLFITGVGIFLLIMSIIKFKKVYIEKKEK